jgi:saccharopine dehydrogenase-like NADP-dependent oxidoreductase
MDRILVLGAAGSVGSCIVRDLVERSDMTVTAADVRPAAPSAGAKAPSRLTSVVADIGDDSRLRQLVGQADIVVNATAMRYAMPVTHAALDMKVNLVDLGTYHDTEAQLELSETAAAAGVCIVIGAGVAPGLTSILARYGADQLDKVDSIRIHSFLVNALFESAANVNDRLDALKLAGIARRDGVLVKTAPLAENEQVEFAEPFGRQWVHLMPHPEALTLPRYVDVPNVEFKTGYPAAEEAIIAALRDSGLDSMQPFQFRDVIVEPRRFVAAVIGEARRGSISTANVKRVNVAGWQSGSHVQLAYDLAVQLEGGSATSLITGTMASIAAISVVAGGRPGVHSAEGGLDAKVVLGALVERGFVVTETRTVTGDARGVSATLN